MTVPADTRQKPKLFRVISRMNIGGPAHHASWLHRAFLDFGWDAELAYGRLDEGEGDFSSSLDGLKNVHYLPDMIRPMAPLADLKSVIQLYSLLKRSKPDILHTHTAKAGLVGRLAAVLYNLDARLHGRNRLVCLHTYHGHVFTGYFSPLMEKLVRFIESFLWHFTDRIITLTPSLGREICGLLDKSDNKLSIVPLGLDLSPLLKVQRSDIFNRHFGTDKRVWVGWVGRMVEIKNPSRFLEVAEGLKQRLGNDTGFVLVGDGHLAGGIREEIRRRGLSDSVFLYGWSRDLEGVYSGLDLFCNTSDNEGTPVAVLESMVAGVPVMATDVGGTAEILEGISPAWLFPPASPDAASLDPVAKYLNAPSPLPDELRKDIARRFSRERLADDLKQLYLELLKSH